jgi:hypothetical protein
LYKNIFVIAENDAQAKKLALKKVSNGGSHHRNYQFDTEKIIEVDGLINKQDKFIHLIPSNDHIKFEF